MGRPPMLGKTLILVSVNMESDVIAKLDVLARRELISRAVIIRAAVDRLLDAIDSGKPLGLGVNTPPEPSHEHTH